MSTPKVDYHTFVPLKALSPSGYCFPVNAYSRIEQRPVLVKIFCVHPKRSKNEKVFEQEVSAMHAVRRHLKLHWKAYPVDDAASFENLGKFIEEQRFEKKGEAVYWKKVGGFLIIELAEYGDLYDVLSEYWKFKAEPLPEFVSQAFIAPIVRTLANLHKEGFAHRDVKPENIVLNRYLETTLIDFGFCKKTKNGMVANDERYSQDYAAPEVLLLENYDAQKADVYSLGKTILALVSGTVREDKGFKDLSEDCKELLHKMLEKNPKKRISMNEVLKSKWLQSGMMGIDVVRRNLGHALEQCCLLKEFPRLRPEAKAPVLTIYGKEAAAKRGYINPKKLSSDEEISTADTASPDAFFDSFD